MLIKIDHRVSWAISEDRADVIAQLQASKKLYGWVDGENVGKTLDKFAVANRHATFGDLMEWSKRTYLDRLEQGESFNGYKMEGDYNPTKGENTNQEFSKHGVSVIEDAEPAKRKSEVAAAKVRQDLKRVAKPGGESEVDEADRKALEAEGYADAEQKRIVAAQKSEMAGDEQLLVDDPKTPPNASAREFPGVEQGHKSESPVGEGSGLGAKKEPTPLEKRGLGK